MFDALYPDRHTFQGYQHQKDMRVKRVDAIADAVELYIAKKAKVIHADPAHYRHACHGPAKRKPVRGQSPLLRRALYPTPLRERP